MDTKNLCIGDEAQRRRSILNLDYPVRCGFIFDYDDLEKMWKYGFDDVLGVNPKDHPLLLNENPWNYMADKEWSAKVTNSMLFVCLFVCLFVFSE